MAHGQVSEIVPAPSSAVFDVVHDYSRRLDWDTLLRVAYLDDGFTIPGTGVTAVCVGRRSLGSIELKTIYVTFERPTLAAIKMVNAPAFVHSWAASIHHEDIGEYASRITYKFHFTTKPRVLQFILDPLLQWVFLWETRKRLRALKAFFARSHNS